MYHAFKIIVFSCFVLVSCQGRYCGRYVGEIKSKVKSISSSTIELGKDKQFILSTTSTYLGNPKPLAGNVELHGSYSIKRNEIILEPKSKRTNSIIYKRNLEEGKDKIIGSRQSAYKVTDTIFGQSLNLIDAEVIQFYLSKRKNSRYVWNKEDCFVKYDKTSTENDLKNYCMEVRN